LSGGEEKFDEVDYWSQVKLAIVKEYLGAYSTIMSAQRNPSFSHAYVDAFSGPGVSISKTSGEFILGSPLNALEVKPPFRQFYFIDMDGDKATQLTDLCEGRENVHVFEGDCNERLLKDVFPHLRYKDFRRAVCLLDPYGMDVHWDVVQFAGHMRSIELFLNFPTMDINRNALLVDPGNITSSGIERMTAFWGDDSWRSRFYEEKPALFDPMEEKEASNLEVVNAYRERLKEVAGFEYVSEGMPMRNRKNAVIYYLLFASQKPVAENIIMDIFKKWGTKREL